MAKRKTPQVQNAEQGPSDEQTLIDRDLERALARLDIVMSFLGRAGNGKCPIEIDLAMAAALHDVMWSAVEDLAGLRGKLRGSSTAG